MTWTPLVPVTGSSLALFFPASAAFSLAALSSWALHSASSLAHSISSLALCSASSRAFLSASAFLSTSSCALRSASCRTLSSASAFAFLQRFFSPSFAALTSCSSSVSIFNSSVLALVQSLVVLPDEGVVVVVDLAEDMVKQGVKELGGGA